MQKGDILVTDNGLGGISGHAGIAISAEHILTINGYWNTTTLEPLSTWMKKNAGSKGTTWVRRLKNTTIAYKAGDWAYKNYWNASGGTKQTIRPSYGFRGSRYDKNPTYCSKIVLQAYYFGSGSAPVVKVFPSLVAPRDLHTYFSSSYYPYQVAKK
ncbi:hypothetical protein [Listeria costaricensis]|uniref:hypothetical protein n=1 Tax=Listeria costaricensis TaxID=2026604 RepID=UPI000C076DE1|nr:hypothetical protein [Listeria costaricensis]